MRQTSCERFAGSDRGSMGGWSLGPVAGWDGTYICGWPVGKFVWKNGWALVVCLSCDRLMGVGRGRDDLDGM